MENVHRQVQALANTLQESEEYKNYIEAKKKLYENEEVKRQLFDFKRQQFTIQTEQFSGKHVDDGKLKGLQSFYSTLMVNPIISNFIHSELKLTKLLSDIYKTINDAIDIDIDFIK